METGFLSFFVLKLKQIHIDKGITAGYRTNIPQCIGFQMTNYLPNLDKHWWHNKSNKIITYWNSFLTCSLFQQNTFCGNNKECHVTSLISVQHVFITSTTLSFHPHLMKPTSSTKHSAVISLLQQGYSLHQIESKTGLGKSIIGRINKKMDGDKENSKGGHPSKLSWATSDQLSVKSPVEDLIMLWRLPISSSTSFLILSHPKQSGMHSNKMTFVLLSRGNTLFSRRATDWSISNLPDTMKTGQWRIGRVPRSMQAVIKAKGGHTKY